MIITAGATNKSVYFYIVGDASHASPGDPLTGLLFSDIETGGSASYARQGAARVDLTLITLASASAAHADGGFIEVDVTNMPGVYRCDFPDAAWVTGVDQVVCHLVVASANNAAVAPILVDITNIDLRDAVRAGMTALPAAAADGAGGLPISDAGGADMDSLFSTLVSGIAGETRNANLLDQLKTIIAVIEHQRGSHTHQPIGNILFVDPINGDTHASGNRGGISDPYSLVQDCHDNAVTDSNHDLIILLSGAAAGATTLTEDVTLSKRYLSIRGPGREFIWTRSGAGDTIAVTADGVGLEGFQLNTAATGNGCSGASR